MDSRADLNIRNNNSPGMSSAKSIQDLSEMVRNLTMRNYHLEEKVKEQSRKLRESSECIISKSNDCLYPSETSEFSWDDLELIDIEAVDVMDEQCWLLESNLMLECKNGMDVYSWLNEDMDIKDPAVVSAQNALFSKMNELSRGYLRYSNNASPDKSPNTSKTNIYSPVSRSSVDSRTYKKGKQIGKQIMMNETYDFEEMSTCEVDGVTNDKNYPQEYFEEEEICNNEASNTFRDVGDIQTAARLQEESLRMSSSSYSNLDEDYERLCRPKDCRMTSREFHDSQGSSLDGSAKSADSPIDSPFGSQTFDQSQLDSVYSSLPNLTQRKILQNRKPYPHSYGSGAVMNKHKSDSRLSRPTLTSCKTSHVSYEQQNARLQVPRMHSSQNNRIDSRRSRSPAISNTTFHNDPNKYVKPNPRPSTGIPRPQTRLPGPKMSSYKSSKTSVYTMEDEAWKDGCF